MFGVGLGGARQNLSPSPSRFLVPGGGWTPWQRLCIARFFGCSKIRSFLFVYFLEVWLAAITV